MKYLVSATAAMLLFTSAVQAHTHVEKSSPADNSTVSVSPKEIVLHFNEAARLTALTIQKEGATEQAIMTSPAAPSKTATVPITLLSPGKYVVTYRVVGDDNHVMSGKLHFTVGAP